MLSLHLQNMNQGRKIQWYQHLPFRPASTIPTYWKIRGSLIWRRELPRADFRYLRPSRRLWPINTAPVRIMPVLMVLKYRFFTGPDEVPAEIESTVLTNGWLDQHAWICRAKRSSANPYSSILDCLFRCITPMCHMIPTVCLFWKNQFRYRKPERGMFLPYFGISTSLFSICQRRFDRIQRRHEEHLEFKINKFSNRGLNDLPCCFQVLWWKLLGNVINQWSLTGINRNAYLLAAGSRLRIRDFFTKPDLKRQYRFAADRSGGSNEDNHTEDIVVEAKISDAKKPEWFLSQDRINSKLMVLQWKKTSISLQLKNATPGRMKFHTAMTFWSILKTNEGKIIESLFAKRLL